MSVHIGSPQLGYIIKKTAQNFRILIRGMLNFDVIAKGLGLVSLPNFVNDFPRKVLMLYSIN